MEKELPKEFINNLAIFSEKYICKIRTAIAKNANEIYKDKAIVKIFEMLKTQHFDYMVDLHISIDYVTSGISDDVTESYSEKQFRNTQDVLYELLKHYWQD